VNRIIKGGGRDGGQRLIKLYRSLAPADQETLLAFGEFLAARDAAHVPEASEPLEPASMSRPRDESVVGAIKRLSRQYYMLNRGAMLNDTSALMGAHVLQGRLATEVIDELENLFTRRYAEYREEKTPEDT